MTTDRFYVSLVLFHLLSFGAVLLSAERWRRPERCRAPRGRWLAAVSAHALVLAVGTYLLSLVLTTALGLGTGRPLRLGPVSGRLTSHAVFVESALFAAALSYRHARAGSRRRAFLLGTCGLAVAVVGVDAMVVEPRLLRVPGPRCT